MKTKPYIPRVNVALSEELARDLAKYIPWGQRGAVVRCLLEDLVRFLEDAEKPQHILTGIVTGDIGIAVKRKEPNDGDT